MESTTFDLLTSLVNLEGRGTERSALLRYTRAHFIEQTQQHLMYMKVHEGCKYHHTSYE